MPSDGVHSLQTHMSTTAPVSAAVPLCLDHATWIMLLQVQECWCLVFHSPTLCCML